MNTKRYSKLGVWLLAFVLGAGLGLAFHPVRAAGLWFVTTGGNDGNDCQGFSTACSTINGALNKPGFTPGDTVMVAAGTYFGTGDQVVLIGKDVTVTGGWNPDFTMQIGTSIIDGQGQRRVITVCINSGLECVEGPVIVTLEQFIITNGYTLSNPGEPSNPGAGIWNRGGTLTLNHITVSDSKADGLSGEGGGIFNQQGVVILDDSTISNNTAHSGGGIWNNGGDVTIISSTIGGNEATSETSVSGGGIFNDGDMIIIASTISGNMAPYGGGIQSEGLVPMVNTILAGNIADVGPDCGPPFFGPDSLGHNLIGDTTEPGGCTITLLPTDITGDPGLGAFTDDGRPGHGHFPLLPTSQAIDAGDNDACPSADQLGAPRPADGNADGIATCDIGAIEGIEGATVTIDIKPGSDPNCFNIDGHGVIPVAILGEAGFDVGDVDTDSLFFAGYEVRVRGNGQQQCAIEDVNDDGFEDLVCQFVDDDPATWALGDGEAVLTGSLTDGTTFEGSDSICVVP